MRFRALNRLYAWLLRYFWLPCPLCGRQFGGHEWKERDGRSAAIKSEDGALAICPVCTAEGRGNDYSTPSSTEERPA